MKLRRTCVVIIGSNFAIVPGEVAACQMCAFAQADYGFPPWLPWFFLGLVWCLGQSLISSRRGIKTWFQPRIKVFIVMAIVAVVLGALSFGPLLGVLFFVGPPLAFGRALFPRWWRMDATARRWTLTLGSVMLILLTGTATYSYNRAAHITRVDYALKWNGTALARQIFDRMEQEGPSALPELHEVLDRGDSYASWNAIRAINKLQPEENQMEKLLSTYRRIFARNERYKETYGSDDSFVAMYEDVMRKYSGLDLPSESTPEAWEEAWRNANEQRGPREP